MGWVKKMICSPFFLSLSIGNLSSSFLSPLFPFLPLALFSLPRARHFSFFFDSFSRFFSLSFHTREMR